MDERAVELLNEFGWEIVHHYMDYDICESIDQETELKFMVEYLKKHLTKYNQEFVIN